GWRGTVRGLIRKGRVAAGDRPQRGRADREPEDAAAATRGRTAETARRGHRATLRDEPLEKQQRDGETDERRGALVRHRAGVVERLDRLHRTQLEGEIPDHSVVADVMEVAATALVGDRPKGLLDEVGHDRHTAGVAQVP